MVMMEKEFCGRECSAFGKRSSLSLGVRSAIEPGDAGPRGREPEVPSLVVKVGEKRAFFSNFFV
jgi:hypothetical protein